MPLLSFFALGGFSVKKIVQIIKLGTKKKSLMQNKSKNKITRKQQNYQMNSEDSADYIFKLYILTLF